jgi:hypothetical protein
VIKARSSLVLLAICWIVILKYQPFLDRTYVGLFYNACLAFVAFYCVNLSLNSGLDQDDRTRQLIVGVSTLIMVLAFTGLFFGKPSLYEKWAGLGGGTLYLNGNYLNGKVQIFGDLLHLTSAAKCEKAIIVGTDVCDPWERVFNQNPIVAELFRGSNLTSVYIVGFSSLILLYVTVFKVIRKLKIKSITPYLMAVTPVAILSIDRANELITLTLILIGFFALQTRSLIYQSLGALSILAACVFKLWPIVCACLIIGFFWKRIYLIPKCILALSVIYWIPKVELIFRMLDSTQSGYPSGYSFGLKLFWHSQLPAIYTVVIIILSLALLFLFIGATKSSLDKFIRNPIALSQLYSMIPLIMTFSAIWALGDSYIYRMIILFPVVLLVAQFNTPEFAFPRFLLSAILVASIVSLTPFVLVATSSLALYFVYLSHETVRAQRDLKASFKDKS